MNKTMLERECIEEIRRWRDEVRLVDEGQVVFVPTMGALHDGHASLISQAKSLGRYVVVSIFVNRFQFNDPQDYENYPDTRVEDLNVCRDLGVDLVFMPKHAQMYPEEPLTSISVERLSQHLCGSSRPGHFDGVGIVVSKLLNIVEPDIAVFGEKDLQQLQIVRRIVRDLSMT